MNTEQKRLLLSVCMISGAEAHRIGRALESVADWAGEILVVLNQAMSRGVTGTHNSPAQR